MMLDRKFKTAEDIELLERWMKTSPANRPKEVPAKLAEYLERLHLANTLRLTHGSKRLVWPMLVAIYKSKGISYSDSTARRDVNDAERLFSTITRQTGRWATEYMIDNIFEQLDSCRRAGKHREYAMLSATLDRYLERADRYATEDAEMQDNPVPVFALQDPSEMGIKPDPNAAAKLKAWNLKRDQMRKAQDDNATDAEFTEDTSADE